MKDYRTIKGLRSLPEFEKIIRKITLHSVEKPIELEKTEKIFLKRSFVLKTYPHLFPLGEGVWGQ